MQWNEFEKEFKPLKNHLDNNASLDGSMYETYGAEYEYILEIDKKEPNKVWTYLDTDNGPILTSGFHTVNRIGYLITNEGFDLDTFIEVIDD